MALSRSLLQAASSVRAELLRRDCHDAQLEIPVRDWKEVVRLQRLRTEARYHGWHRAAHRLKLDLLQHIELLQRQLMRLLDDHTHEIPSERIPSEGELYRELLAVQREFGHLEVDQEAKELFVVTDPIVLEDIPLGSFEIRLQWNRLASSCPYRIVAVDPNPAAANDETTHPHVSGEILCEGDGKTAIRAALAEGRLYDFFTLVSQLLKTYGRGRAFVELESWYGTPCHDCGGTVDDEDRSSCDGCDEYLCNDCVICCRDCDRGYCSGCISACETCGRSCCDSCLSTCADCPRDCCSECLTNSQCSRCQEKELENDHETDEDDTTEPASTEPNPAVQPAGLGQIDLPAGPG